MTSSYVRSSYKIDQDEDLNQSSSTFQHINMSNIVTPFFILAACASLSLSQFQFGLGVNLFTPEAVTARDIILKTYGAMLSLQGRTCPRCIFKLSAELLDLDDENKPLDAEERQLVSLVTTGLVTDTPAVKAARQLLVSRMNGYLRLVGRAGCANCAAEFLEEILKN